MAQVAKPIIVANAFFQGCKEAIFRFVMSFKTQKSDVQYALSCRINFVWNTILMNEIGNALSFFQAIGFLVLIRAEVIIQAVWAWMPGRLIV